MCIAEYHGEAVWVENRRSQQCLQLCLCTERERETAKHAHAHIATYRRHPLGDSLAEARVPEERLNYLGKSCPYIECIQVYGESIYQLAPWSDPVNASLSAD